MEETGNVVAVAHAKICHWRYIPRFVAVGDILPVLPGNSVFGHGYGIKIWQIHRFAHMADDLVGQKDDRCAVFLGQLKSFDGQVEGLADGDRA